MQSKLRATSLLGVIGCALVALAACQGEGGEPTSGKAGLALVNGDFESDTTDPWWQSTDMNLRVEDGRLCADVPAGTTNVWDAIIGQNDLELTAGAQYKLSFTASGSTPNVATALVQLPMEPWTQYANIAALVSPEPTYFEQTFTAPSDTGPLAVQFQIGGAAEAWTFCVDDVDVALPEVELVRNGDFAAGTTEGWWESGQLVLDAEGGELYTAVPAGGDAWSYIVGQDAIPLREGQTYHLSFAAHGAPAGAEIRALVQMGGEPYTVYFELNPVLEADAQTYSGTFTSPVTTDTAHVQFQLGGAEQAYTFYVDDVSLLTNAPIDYYTPDTGPRVRVNQVGYPVHAVKHATLVTEATEPLDFEVLDGGGGPVLSGTSQPRGLDPSSGLNVHVLDLTALVTPGADYTVVADGEESYPFAVAADPYESLRADSLDFYYTQRSGIEILGEIAGAAYARPAGHVSAPGAGPNQGDLDVPCQPAENSEPIYGVPWTCDYTLDVTGGWYDAGDHGKYVVNGGISVYQLLNAFERQKWADTRDKGALDDGTLAIPEQSNGVPDVLDEVRWELEFFLKMQVPEGQPLAGMAHHKVHDDAWTGLPMLPDQDPQLRWLHRPSTAATLNLAATAAQGARIYKHYDKAFAARLLTAAERAWEAAIANPELYAPAEDGASGGGPYEDYNVGDEFYWAAAELFITTGEKAYRDAVLASPYHTADVFTAGGFSWQSVAALGRLDLATVENTLPRRVAVRASVLAGADAYLAAQAQNAFGQPYAPDDGQYVWGSNSQILNNIVVLGVAFDLSGDTRYRDGALEGLDYLLGRNALNRSYVRGYGTVESHNMHSRMYANQLNPALPNPPMGAVSGGPNSFPSQWDPTAVRLFLDQGCDPQFCYVDDINSWSTNEITINWNSALAWVASWAADQDDARSPQGN
jgi:endoglucanase